MDPHRVEPAWWSSADLRDALRTLEIVLQRHRIWHCLHYGTLLGAVRDGDVIEWDHDIDLLVRPGDVPRILALNAETEPEGFRFTVRRMPGGSLAVNPGRVPWFDIGWLRVERNGVTWADLWAPTLFADGCLRHYDLDAEVSFWSEGTFPAFHVERLGTAEISGDAYPVPVHAERLLTALYGPDWRTPIRSAVDGGERLGTRTVSGGVLRPSLDEHVAWCRDQGWDQARYRGQPDWPRRLRGAGPTEAVEGTARTTRSAWWHTLDEIGEQS
jgi:hypothetical protein